MNLRSRDRNDLYRLDLRDGSHVLVPTEPGLTDWISDAGLVVRAAQRRHDDGGVTIVVRDDEESPWRPLLTMGYADAVSSQVVGFTSDERGLLLLSPLGAETTRLLRLSCATGQLEVIYGDPHYDVTGVSLHPKTGEVDLVSVERERLELVALSTDTAADLACIRTQCRGDVTPLGRDLDNRFWLLQDLIDDGPVAYRLFHRDSGAVETLFVHEPALEPYQLSTVEPFSFEARDGLRISGYLTFPIGARQHLPTVVNVHGGPWDRNRWGLRADSQWLANRGYLCIEVNFRGSAGFGRSFMLAGDREWGGKMQDDLIDALNWAVRQGFADPERVAIYGTSYGGYAALAGAAFTPELFRCAVACAAPVNLVSFIESVPGYWPHVRNDLVRRVGDPRTEAEFLWSRSPLSRVNEIRTPLLLAYGRNDARVPVSEAEQLVKALQVNGIPHQYLLFENEGHGFGKLNNVLTFRAMAEKLLAEHLGGRYEPVED
jgi:dipeptidyl aminopeptidase/acylaminoacyl peptidase